MKLKILLAVLLSGSTILGMEEKPNLKRKRIKIEEQSSENHRPSATKRTKKEKKAVKRKFDGENNKEYYTAKKLHKDATAYNRIINNLKCFYFEPSILNGANDIFEAIEIIEKYITSSHQTIFSNGNAFETFNNSPKEWIKFRKKIRELYIPQLNERFLEKSESQKGLYPKNDEWYSFDILLNQNIANFIARITENDDLIFNLCSDFNFNRSSIKRLIKLLLFYGFDLNIRNSKGETALYSAVFHHYPNQNRTDSDNTELITILLNEGANPNIKNLRGQTCLSSAICHSYSTNENKVEIIELLLEHSADPNLDDIYEGTPLHSAIIKNFNTIDMSNIVALLLKMGANPNLKNRCDDTALHTALFLHSPTDRNNENIIKLLLQNRANPYIRNGSNKSAFDIAEEENFNGFAKLVDKYTENTLLKICVSHILKNISRYEDKLDTLPIELKDKINSLKS